MVEYWELFLSTASTGNLKVMLLNYCRPNTCLHGYSFHIVYSDHTKENEGELSVKKGDVAGLVEKDSYDVYWTVS